MRRGLGLLLLLLLATHALPVESQTGIYFPLVNWSRPYLFTSVSASEPQQPYNRGPFSLFVSLYGENFFELTLTLGFDRYLLEETHSFRPRYQVGFEAGKLFSLPLMVRERRILCGDFSLGLFMRFNMMGPSGATKMYSDWGLYGACRLRIELGRGQRRRSSIDVGYKVLAPVHFSYYPGDHTVLIQSHCIFAGISF